MRKGFFGLTGSVPVFRAKVLTFLPWAQLLTLSGKTAEWSQRRAITFRHFFMLPFCSE